MSNQYQMIDNNCQKFKNDFKDLLLNFSKPEVNRGTWSTFIQLNGMFELMELAGLTMEGRRCVDFGCGGLKRHSVSSLLYLYGAREAMSVDLYEDPDQAAVAFAVWALLITIISGVGDFDYKRITKDLRSLQRRASEFDLVKLFNGDLSGLPESIYFRLNDYRNLSSNEKQFDTLVSFSVFEHVPDIANCLSSFRNAITADGFIYATIDYKDHRSYVSDANWWQFMIDDGDLHPNYITKIRHTEMASLINSAGFEIAESKIIRVEPQQNVRTKFLSKYSNLSDDDINIVEAWVLLKPI